MTKWVYLLNSEDLIGEETSTPFRGDGTAREIILESSAQVGTSRISVTMPGGLSFTRPLLRKDVYNDALGVELHNYEEIVDDGAVKSVIPTGRNIWSTNQYFTVTYFPIGIYSVLATMSDIEILTESGWNIQVN